LKEAVCALQSGKPRRGAWLSAQPSSSHIDYAYGMFAATVSKTAPSQETIMFSKAFAIAIAAVCLSTPVLADDATPDTNGGRYTLNKVTDGFVRLDTQTGEVALCSQRTVGWACQAAPEDRAAFESEIARLRGENAALKQALLSRGLPLPSGATPERSDNHDNDITIRLPDNADIDRAVAYVSRLWNRFVDAVNRAQKQMLNKS
jgi:hypothetical protein